MLKKYLIFIIVIVWCNSLFSQTSLPKYEFRGGWIATVINLDWPSSPNASTQDQKEELLYQLDEMKRTGINAVIFQIRSECDAMYDSNYDPWSYYLTGAQGVPPSPYWDPLEFAVEEAHKRGMELHAWFNPYRAVKTVGSYPIHSTHVSSQNPSWVIRIGDIKFLDPGLPMVRDYVTNVIMDVVNRYDIDGVHFDDYFYPYPPEAITNEDATTFAQYPRGFSYIHDWRRDNVNIFVQQLQDTINQIKPYIKWGISPFGIWQNGVPSGITGLSAYHTIYCDALAWLTNQTVDYIAPQCYWAINDAGQWYDVLVPWWANQLNSRHLYVGQIINSSYTNDELPNQIQINRQTTNVHGNIIFRSKILVNNSKSFKDSLINNYFRYPAITPVMNWKDSILPNEPRNLRYVNLPDSSIAALQWEVPSIASDGDSASRYVVYKFDYNPTYPNDFSDPANILSVEGLRFSSPQEPTGTGPYYYAVTSLDRNSNESIASNVLSISPPPLSQLIYPVNNAINMPDSIPLQWENSDFVSRYNLQVCTDSLFSSNVININNIADTLYNIWGLEGEQNYFWRIQAKNAGGTGTFSDAFKFGTGFPVAPVLAYPAYDSTNLPLEPTLGWQSVQSADNYRLQVAKSLDFNPTSIVYDSSGITDTSITIGPLQANKRHHWRVKAINTFGLSVWSNLGRFKTVNPAIIEDLGNIPLEYSLQQNFPNPFNATTHIKFSIKELSDVILKIYDIKGRVIDTIVNSRLNRGKYEISYDANHLASGIYIYVLKTDKVIMIKKMVLVK